MNNINKLKHSEIFSHFCIINYVLVNYMINVHEI